MYFHNVIHIECPSCRTNVHLDSKCNYCYACGRVFNSLENNNLEPKNT